MVRPSGRVRQRERPSIVSCRRISKLPLSQERKREVVTQTFSPRKRRLSLMSRYLWAARRRRENTRSSSTHGQKNFVGSSSGLRRAKIVNGKWPLRSFFKITSRPELPNSPASRIVYKLNDVFGTLGYLLHARKSCPWLTNDGSSSPALSVYRHSSIHFIPPLDGATDVYFFLSRKEKTGP